MKLFLYFFAALLTANIAFAKENNYFVQKIDALSEELVNCSMQLLKVPDTFEDDTIDKQTMSTILHRSKMENQTFRDQVDNLELQMKEQSTYPSSKFSEEVCVPLYKYCLFEFHAQVRTKLPYFLKLYIDFNRAFITILRNDLNRARGELERYSSEDLKICDKVGTEKLPYYCKKLEDGKEAAETAEWLVSFQRENINGTVGLAFAKMRKDTTLVQGMYRKYVIDPVNDCLNNNIIPSWLPSR